MARPVAADAAATKQSILDATLDLLEESWPPPSTRAVARKAGVSVAIVHHYYGNKKGLTDACIDTMYAELSKLGMELASELRTGKPKEQLLEETTRTGYAFARRHRSALRLLTLEVAEHAALDPSRKRMTEGPFLAIAADGLSSELSITVAEARLRLRTILSTVSRYATLSDEDLAKTTGLPVGPGLHAAVEAHLVSLVRLLLLPR
jgi:AcrR family transcriptional regulator